MSIRADFLGYVFDVKPGTTRAWDDGLQVEARAMYSVSGEMLAKGEEFLNNWDRRNSYMIGLYIGAKQVVEVFYYDNSGKQFQLVMEPTVTRELNEYFGAEPGKTWVGLVAPEPRPQRKVDLHRSNQTAAFDVLFRIKPASTAQFIPLVARYRFDAGGKLTSFRTGFMPGLWRVPRLERSAQGTMILCDARGIHPQK